jgi:hypothetical protein
VYKKAIWVAFILAVLLLAFWLVGKASCEIYRYSQLKISVEADIESWSVREMGSEQFAVIAHYTYFFNGISYTGQGRIGGIYPNPWAAQEAKSRFIKQKRRVWIAPAHPERSVVEKHFPMKRVISAGVVIGLVIYFLILTVYVKVKTAK